LLRAGVDPHRSLDPRSAAFSAADAGITALVQGDPDAAEEAFDESSALAAGGDPWTRSHAIWVWAWCGCGRSGPRMPRGWRREALRLVRDVDNRSGIALGVAALPWAAAELHQEKRAASLLGATAPVWRSIPADPPAPMAALGERYTAAVRGALGDGLWSARAEEGRAHWTANRRSPWHSASDQPWPNTGRREAGRPAHVAATQERPTL
jgi:hypothetical protein